VKCSTIHIEETSIAPHKAQDAHAIDTWNDDMVARIFLSAAFAIHGFIGTEMNPVKKSRQAINITQND
jgi:hypothetical protein